MSGDWRMKEVTERSEAQKLRAGVADFVKWVNANWQYSRAAPDGYNYPVCRVDAIFAKLRELGLVEDDTDG